METTACDAPRKRKFQKKKSQKEFQSVVKQQSREPEWDNGRSHSENSVLRLIQWERSFKDRCNGNDTDAMQNAQV